MVLIGTGLRPSRPRTTGAVGSHEPGTKEISHRRPTRAARPVPHDRVRVAAQAGRLAVLGRPALSLPQRTRVCRSSEHHLVAACADLALLAHGGQTARSDSTIIISGLPWQGLRRCRCRTASGGCHAARQGCTPGSIRDRRRHARLVVSRLPQAPGSGRLRAHRDTPSDQSRDLHALTTQ